MNKNLYEFKVVVLGDKGVGKTCLVLRFIEGYYSAKQQSTIGAFFLTKKIVLSDDSICKMQLWDTAGQERFRAMAPMYYRNASAAIVCFDITNEDSFTKMKDWVEELKQNVPSEQLIIAIACTKSDLESERVVSRSRAENFATRVDATLFETSAKDNIGVDEIFRQISEQIVQKMGNTLLSGRGSTRGSAVLGAGQQQGGGQPLGTSSGSRSDAKSSSDGCC